MRQEHFWKGKKVLVTGAGGFIGSHLTEELIRRGAQVRAMARYNSRGTFGWLDDLEPETRKSIELFQGDVRDASRVHEACREREYVFHLAAMISIPYSYLSPSEAHAVNTQGTLHVLNACRDLQVKRLMHTSTSEVYGTAQYVPIDEKHPLQGQSPYSASKIGADQLTESYFRTYGLGATIIRPFNTYGPRQSARAVIPTILVQSMMGAEVRLGSLHPTRDFTYVSDTVDGMIRSLEVEDSVGKTLNLGVGEEISIGNLVSLIEEVTGKKIRVNTEKERKRPEKSEVERLLSNNELACRVMSWKPGIGLREGLGRTWKWLENNLELYKRAQKEYVV